MTNYYGNLVSFILPTNFSKKTTVFLIGSAIHTSTKPLIDKVYDAFIQAGIQKEHITIEIVADVEKPSIDRLAKQLNENKFDHTVILNEKVAGEVNLRKTLRQIAAQFGTFSDLPFASERLIELSFEKSFAEIQSALQPLYERLKTLTDIKVTSQNGTDLILHFAPEYTWINSNGHVAKKDTEKDVAPSGNLFPAEIYTFPNHVSGTLVADSFYLAALQLEKYRIHPQSMHEDFLRTPITITIADSVVTQVTCPDSDMESFVRHEIFEVDPTNGKRIGEFSLPGILSPTKEYFSFPPLLEKIRPHIAHGHGYPEKTGSPYDSPVHGDFGLDDVTVIDLSNNETIFAHNTYQF